MGAKFVTKGVTNVVGLSHILYLDENILIGALWDQENRSDPLKGALWLKGKMQ